MSSTQLRKQKRASAGVAAAGGPRISLAMIVRNEAEGLARCLSSVAAGVDEIVIVDTGSSDDTTAIARRFTDRVCDYAWSDDFAAARQHAYDLARGEWILWLDGDDEFTGHTSLRSLISAQPADVGSIALRYITGLDDHGNVTQEFWRERITRRGCYRWVGRVHEVLQPVGTLRQVEAAECFVTHHGKAGMGTAGLERNVRILAQMAAEQGGADPRTLYYLARDQMNLGKITEALEGFKRYLEVAIWAEERYSARLFLAQLTLLTADYDAAHTAALAALAEWPAWPQAYFLLAQIAYYRKEWPKVLAWCDIGRGLPIPEGSLFVNPHALRAGWIIYYTNALWHTGHAREALQWTRTARELLPDDLFHKRNLAFFSAAALGVTLGTVRAPADAAIAAAEGSARGVTTDGGMVLAEDDRDLPAALSS